MGNHYLDIETTGLDEKEDKIITIQFQPLDQNTAKPKGKLVILKEWESSEKEILQHFIKQSQISDPYPFSFVPIGYNLGFEHNFFRQRCIKNGIPPIDLLNKPFIDLKTVGVLMNRGQFKGAGLDKITGKPHDGRIIPTWYDEKKFAKIVEYIQLETSEFLKLASWLYKEMPELLVRFKQNTRTGK